MVVQRLLAPEKSGVMFTVDPVRKRRDQMVIEAVHGLGESVVSGTVTPDHYIVSRDGELKRVQVSTQTLADVAAGLAAACMRLRSIRWSAARAS